MAREPETPDRNFFANGGPEENLEGLRNAIDRSEPAVPFNGYAKIRIGKVISGAVLKTKRQMPSGQSRPLDRVSDYC